MRLQRWISKCRRWIAENGRSRDRSVNVLYFFNELTFINFFFDFLHNIDRGWFHYTTTSKLLTFIIYYASAFKYTKRFAFKVVHVFPNTWKFAYPLEVNG